MKRKLALDKSLSRVLSLCFSLFSFACASQETLQSRVESSAPLELATETPPAKSYAQLITPQTTQRFQHLRKHQGQLLLARENLQLIFSGIPPISSHAAFSPLFAKAYRLTHKTWSAQPWLPIPELALRTPEGERLSLVGQDLENVQGHFRLVSIFRAARAEARVYLSFVAQGSALEVEIDSVNGKELLWDIRFGSGLGEEHPIPYEGDRLAGLTIALLPDVSSIVSSVALKAEREDAISTASPSARGGFYVLLDRQALGQQARLVERALSCYAPLSAPETQSESQADSLECLRAAWAPGPQWTVQLPAKTPVRGEKRLMQALYVHTKEGSFRSVLPLFEGEQLKIAQPLAAADAPGEPPRIEALELLVPDREGVLQHRSLDPAETYLSLPALERGSLQIAVEPNEASFVEIRDAVHKDGVSLGAWLNVRASDLFSPHTLLQRSWPLQLQVPAGDYQIQVFNGTSVICQQRFTVRPERAQQVRCQAEGPNPKLSPRLSLSLDATQHSPELLDAARIQGTGRVERKMPSSAQKALWEVPLIEATDPDLGLSLRAFPADEALRSEWATYKAQREREGASLLQDFTRFVRAQGKDLQIVLECPAAGFQIEEYEWLALTFEPDVLEVFGCLQAETAQNLLHVAERLQRKSSKAIKLAAAAPQRSLFPLYGEIPAIYLGQTPASPEQLAETLRKGLYSVGLKSEIELDPQTLNASSRVLALKVRSYNLKKRQGLLRVLDQEGPLSEFPLPATSVTEWDLKVPLRLNARSRWLRIELLGLSPTENGDIRTESEGEERSTFLLASTNFLRLDEPR